MADYDLGEIKSKKTKTRKDTKPDLLEDAFSFLKDQLLKGKGKRTMRYLLKNRECKKAEIKKMDFGHWDGKNNYPDLEKHLVEKGYISEEINNTFKYGRNNHKLVFPYKDHNGKITGLWCRIISKNKDEDKYLPLTHPAPKEEFFNINNVSKDSTNVIVTEGYLDNMIATERGMDNVVSIGGKNITKSQIKTAKQRGIKKIILAGDTDEEGIEATEKT